MMGPNAGGPATGALGAAIDATFGSFDKFKVRDAGRVWRAVAETAASAHPLCTCGSRA